MRQNSRLLLALGAAGGIAAVAIYQWRRNSGRRESGGDNDRQQFSEDRSEFMVWRFDRPLRVLPAGKTLRFELSSPAVVHWTVDQWDRANDTKTTRVAPGLHVADLPTRDLPVNTRVQLTFFWPEVNRWEGEDFELKVEIAAQYAT